jgi:hypothetical protein
MSIRPTTRILLAICALLALGACSPERLTTPSRIAAPSASTHDCISGYSVPDGRAC